MATSLSQLLTKETATKSGNFRPEKRRSCCLGAGDPRAYFDHDFRWQTRASFWRGKEKQRRLLSRWYDDQVHPLGGDKLEPAFDKESGSFMQESIGEEQLQSNCFLDSKLVVSRTKSTAMSCHARLNSWHFSCWKVRLSDTVFQWNPTPFLFSIY